MSYSSPQENLPGNELPYGTYEIEIGDSFNDQMGASSTPNFHILRYDFKPKSCSAEKNTYIGISENSDVQVVVPSENMDQLTLYKGSKKPINGDKECLLIFDHSTGQIKMEKLSSNINVKKTREKEHSYDEAIKSEILKIRGDKDHKMEESEPSLSGNSLFSEISLTNIRSPQLDIPSPSKNNTLNANKSNPIENMLSVSKPHVEKDIMSNSSQSSSSSSSDDSDSEKDDEEPASQHGNESPNSNDSDEDDAQALENIMSQQNSQAIPKTVSNSAPPAVNDILQDLYMSDDNQSESSDASDTDS